MQTILVATDFSATASNAVQYAIDAAKEIHAEVVLFHFYKMSAHTANALVSAKDLDKMVQAKKSEFEAYAHHLSSIHHVKVSLVVKVGDFLDEVAQVAASCRCSLLVMGMPRKSFEQDLLGNTTTAAIYKFKFPILAVPATAVFTGIHKILYACDMTRGVHARILEQVKEYARQFAAEVEVLYVGEAISSERVKTGQKDVEEALQGISYSYKNANSDSVIKAIQEEAEELHADILIMTPNKYGFWSSLLHRSKTRAMAANGKIPLLSLAY